MNCSQKGLVPPHMSASDIDACILSDEPQPTRLSVAKKRQKTTETSQIPNNISTRQVLCMLESVLKCFCIRFFGALQLQKELSN